VIIEVLYSLTSIHLSEYGAIIHAIFLSDVMKINIEGG